MIYVLEFKKKGYFVLKIFSKGHWDFKKKDCSVSGAILLCGSYLKHYPLLA
jgi:hypothetical protein